MDSLGNELSSTLSELNLANWLTMFAVSAVVCEGVRLELRRSRGRLVFAVNVSASTHAAKSVASVTTTTARGCFDLDGAGSSDPSRRDSNGSVLFLQSLCLTMRTLEHDEPEV